jgi:branched-chain amino acid aminotransferase
MGMLAFLNGQFVPEERAVIPVSDRGFLLGDGLFETMRVAGGRPFRCAQHLERLARGADSLNIKLPFTPQELARFAGQLIELNRMPEAVLRLTLTRGQGGRGYTPNADVQPTVVMTLHPVPPPANPAGWKLVTSSFRIPAGDPLAAFKTTSKILHIMARAEAMKKRADEALLLNTDGEAVEAASGNLFWIHDGAVCTVPDGCDCLPGITRAVVLEICLKLGLPAKKCVIKPAALKTCAGLFVTQSVLGIVPVATFDGGTIAMSPLVVQLTRAYNELQVRF